MIVSLEPNNIWIVKKLFSKEQCNNWIEYSEGIGFETVEIPRTFHEIREKDQKIFNSRVTIDSFEIADEIWSKIASFIPQNASLIHKLQPQSIEGEYDNYLKHSINERIRFYKYTSDGQQLTKHFDGNFIRVVSDGNQKFIEHSFLTMIIYLNDCEHGGETTFFDNETPDKVMHCVTPETGDVLFFSHYYLHEGSPVTDPSAMKYVMRSDVLFRKPL